MHEILFLGLIAFIFCLNTTNAAISFANNDNEPIQLPQHFSSMFVLTNCTNILSTCEASLDTFAKKASMFLMCAVRFARPVMFCENCVEEYVQFTTIYDFIMQLDETTASGKKCRDALMRSDRIQVVVKAHSFVTNVWQESNCQKCFAYYYEKNGTVEYEISNSTKSFIDLYNTTMDCMQRFAEDSDHLGVIDESGIKNHTSFNRTACSQCSHHYKSLNNLYESLYNDGGDDRKICMDIVDAMNYTRQMWGRDFGCVHARKDYFYVLSVTLFVAALPAVFYISSRLHSNTQELNIRQQQRLDTGGSLDPDVGGGRVRSSSSSESSVSRSGPQHLLPIDDTISYTTPDPVSAVT